MTPKNHKDVYGKRDGKDVILNRVKPFDGVCEFCSAKSDLRPYGPRGEWVCFTCARKDVKAAEKQMDRVIFGEGLN